MTDAAGTIAMQKTGDSKTVAVPLAMNLAVSGVSAVCQTMFGLKLDLAGKPEPISTDEMSYGLNISLVRPSGSWVLGIFGTESSCQNLARVLLGLEETEEPSIGDMLDLLGEITNMVSGTVKGKVEGGSELQLSVPMALMPEECRKYTPKVIPLFGQRLVSADFEGEMFLVWSERERLGLCREASAVLASMGERDEHQLGAAISLIGEAEEHLGADVSEGFRRTLAHLETALLGLLNEECAEAEDLLVWVRIALSELCEALNERYAHQFEELSPPTVASPSVHASDVQRVERDAEILGSIADFLQETEEGLQIADAVLMSAEQGNQTPDSINKLFRVFHSMKGLSSFLDLVDVTQLAHGTETLLAQVREGKLELQGSVLDTVFESTEMMRGYLASIRTAVEKQVAYPACAGMAELLERLEAAARGETLAVARKAPSLQPQSVRPEEAPKLKETVKIDTDLVARLAAAAEQLRAFETQLSATDSEQAGELPAHVRAALASVYEVSALMQMVSLDTLFAKMTRMVRDLSKKTGKLARVAASGEDTMVPRAFFEKLGDPLVHMIRNAVDHGIEATDERKKLGKPLMGTIRLSAEHTTREDKRWLLLELRDDGKGLKRSALMNKAISNGLIEEGAQLSDEQVYDLIFAPGFSTAAAVTAISGRGVGMDVVRRNIQSLGGEIRIDSKEGVGSIFTILLPLAV